MKHGARYYQIPKMFDIAFYIMHDVQPKSSLQPTTLLDLPAEDRILVPVSGYTIICFLVQTPSILDMVMSLDEGVEECGLHKADSRLPLRCASIMNHHSPCFSALMHYPESHL